jgi:hypothetical protein
MSTCLGQILDGFQQICEVQGDLSSIVEKLPKLPTKYGGRGSYVSLDFKVGISFGGTQLHVSAYVEWKDAVSFTARISEYDIEPTLPP